MNCVPTINRIRIFIVDDHAIVRHGLKEILGRSDGIEVVGTAGDERQAKKLIIESSPDVILMDLMMPDKDGAQLCREITKARPKSRVIMLTASTADDAIVKAAAAGAAGFIQKTSGLDELLAAIREVAEGKAQVPMDLVKRGFDSLSGSSPRKSSPEDGGLTVRELQILAQFARGNSYAQIAEFTGKSPITIRNSIYKIQSKLGVRTKQEIVVWAVRHRLVGE